MESGGRRGHPERRRRSRRDLGDAGRVSLLMTQSPCLGLALLVAACNSITTPPEPSAFVVLQRPDTLVAPGAVFDTVAIQVRDASGNPVPGVLVEWSADGEITPLNARTDDVGIARARWVLPGRTVTISSRPISRAGPSGQFTAAATVPGVGTTHLRVVARPFTVDTLDAERAYGCGIRGVELWCWGHTWPLYPTEDGITRRVSLPAEVIPTVVIAAERMLCVLDQTARPHCAIHGDGDRFEPIRNVPGLRSVVSIIAAGVNCGLGATDGAVWCWDLAGPHQQSAVKQHAGPYRTLAGQWDAACVLDAEDQAWCWGSNDSGQLGDGTTTTSSVPVPVAGDLRFVSLAVGYRKACGTEESGAVWCWGNLGAGSQSSVPVRVNVPWVMGPDLRIGYESELYVIRDERVRVLWRGAEFVVSDWFAPHRIRELSLDWSACLRNHVDEVYCSWDLVNHGISESYFPQEPIPVPPPPNGW